ncbi:hypothetical protein [Nannocystis pusilla]|uniref:Lipoprotein n=1 Tax=Nannocystis pusilla TaxID=889268 RepID=A0ABS7TLY1_9BACT|nr:hypothetical protein [Nannocystis pusilla]MBZ5709224.1 hypothetical protein [Nannocystis pusilla]
MNHKLASLFSLLLACGDDGPMNTSATAPTTAPTTNNPQTTSDPPASDTDDGTSSPATDATSTPTSTTSTGANAPVFLTLSTNPGELTEGDSLIVTAILTDPDGVDDIVGGTLLNEDGSTEFGPFVATGQEGSYSFMLSWAQIHEADPIHFENMAESRVFSARFFDQAANSSTRTVAVTLQCPGGSACGGACTDLAVDAGNCGTCGHACSLACDDGTCGPAWSECIWSGDGFMTCDQVCQSIGETCAESQCGKATVQSFGDLEWCMNDQHAIELDEPCDKAQDWVTSAIKCCCTTSG